MMDNIIETNAQLTEKGLFLETTDKYFVLESTVDTDGYYQFDIGYFHDDWESFISIKVMYPDGESADFLHGLLHGRNKAQINIYLKKGKNTLRFQHCFCLGTHIFHIENKGKAENLCFELSPRKDLLFSDKKKSLRTFLKNHREKLLKIETSDGVNIPFETEELNSSNLLLKAMVNVFPNADAIYGLGHGVHTLNYYLENGKILSQKIEIKEIPQETKFQFINFNVGNANATLLFLPNGKKLLIDSATNSTAEEKLIPWLEKNAIKLDYYLLTHFHDDHDGCIDEILAKNDIAKPDSEKVSELIKADREERYSYLKNFSYLDSTMLCWYDELDKIWDLGGVKADILNSRFDENGEAVEIYNYSFLKKNEHNYENSTSVSFMFDYNGFRYYHGADNYAHTQERYMSDMIKAKRTDELNCHWFYANHHFVCDINPIFINTLNPVAVYVPNNFIYHRVLYVNSYKEGVENYYFSDKRLENTLISNEVGSAKVCVNDGNDWYYETLQDKDLFCNAD